MKKLLLSICFAFFYAGTLYAQEAWLPEHLVILDKFGQESNDSRGLILNSSDFACVQEFPDLKSALEGFFTQTKKSDLTFYCLPVVPSGMEIYFDKPLDLHAIVTLYLSID